MKGAPCSIDCPVTISTKIMKNLWPAFEELFDDAEEHALNLLSVPWIELGQKNELDLLGVSKIVLQCSS